MFGIWAWWSFWFSSAFHTISIWFTQAVACRVTAGAVTLRAVSETVTTAAVVEAAGVSVVTVHRWAKQGLLPVPGKVFRGRRGTSSLWPVHAPAQAKWVREQLDAGQTITQVREALERGAFVPAK